MAQFRFNDRWQGRLRAALPEGHLGDELASILEMRDRQLEQFLGDTTGTNAIRSAWISTPQALTSMPAVNAWESGPAATVYTDDTGATGSGYPSITMATGKKVLLLAVVRMDLIKLFSDNYAFGGFVGVGLDGADPSSWGTAPNLKNRWGYQITASGSPWVVVDTPFLNSTVDLTPGTHTFKLQVQWQQTLSGTATIFPRLFACTLAIIPLD